MKRPRAVARGLVDLEAVDAGGRLEKLDEAALRAAPMGQPGCPRHQRPQAVEACRDLEIEVDHSRKERDELRGGTERIEETFEGREVGLGPLVELLHDVEERSERRAPRDRGLEDGR